MTPSPRSAAGFTLIELVVVLGLLSSFLLMLVQLLGSGVDMFSRGQRGQDLADRAHLATAAIRDAMSPMVGPARTTYEPAEPEYRLLVHWDQLGFPEEGVDEDASMVQVVRGTVALSEHEEEQLLRSFYRTEVEENVGGDEEHIEAALTQIVAEAPRQGRATMLLAPWPMDGDGVFLELRRGLFVTAPELQEQEIPVMDVEVGAPEFSRDVFLAATAPVLTGLLHIEFAFWSQETRSWTARTGTGGPEFAWDSTRSDRLYELVDSETAPRAHLFGLDVGQGSYNDLRDDVFPRAVRIIVVVSRSRSEPPEAFLEDAITDDAKTLRVNRIDQLPLGNAGGWLKVGSEWIRYEERRGRTVNGLRRGQRGTIARDHKRGAAVRVGKTVTLIHRFEHGRDGAGGSGDR